MAFGVQDIVACAYQLNDVPTIGFARIEHIDTATDRVDLRWLWCSLDIKRSGGEPANLEADQYVFSNEITRNQPVACLRYRVRLVMRRDIQYNAYRSLLEPVVARKRGHDDDARETKRQRILRSHAQPLPPVYTQDDLLRYRYGNPCRSPIWDMVRQEAAKFFHPKTFCYLMLQHSKHLDVDQPLDHNLQEIRDQIRYLQQNAHSLRKLNVSD